MIPDETPAERLRRLRENAGLSQRALAREVGVTQQVIKYAELGGRPRPENAKLIADFFGMQVTDLFPLPKQ